MSTVQEVIQSWRYVATDVASGRRRRGEIVADSAREARAQLRADGLRVRTLEPLSPGFDTADRSSMHPQAAIRSFRRIIAESTASTQRRRHATVRSDFLDGLSGLLESGVPLADALREFDSPSMARSGLATLASSLASDVRQGVSIGDACSKHPHWFDGVEIAMIRAAHETGGLTATLSRLAERVDRGSAVSRRLIGALAYPSLVLVFGLGVALFLGSSTLPRVAELVEGAGGEMPAISRAVIAAATLVRTQPIWLLGGVAAAALFTLAISRTKLASSLPVVRTWIRVRQEAAIARASELLAELLETGVPLVESIGVVSRATRSSSPRVASELASVGTAIEGGESPRDAFASQSVFSPEFTRLLEIGLQRGELGDVLERHAERAHRRLTRRVDALVAIVEPLAIIVLATIVGVVVMSVILPLAQLQALT